VLPGPTAELYLFLWAFFTITSRVGQNGNWSDNRRVLKWTFWFSVLFSITFMGQKVFRSGIQKNRAAIIQTMTWKLWYVRLNSLQHPWIWIFLQYCNCVKIKSKKWVNATSWWRMRMYRNSFCFFYYVPNFDTGWSWMFRFTLRLSKEQGIYSCWTGLYRLSHGASVFFKIWFAFGQNVVKYTE
jgi:hypothetical protein